MLFRKFELDWRYAVGELFQFSYLTGVRSLAEETLGIVEAATR